MSRFAVFDLRFAIESSARIMEDSGSGIFRMQPEKEIECDLTLQTDDHVMSLRSMAKIPTLKGFSPKDVKLSFHETLATASSAKEARRYIPKGRRSTTGTALDSVTTGWPS